MNLVSDTLCPFCSKTPSPFANQEKNDSLTAERDALKEVIEEIESSVSGGLCSFSATAKHAFLEDIKQVIAKYKVKP